MSEWETVKVGDYITQIRGVSYTPKESSEIPIDNYIPILRAHNIQETGLNFEDLIYISSDNISAVQMIKKGDIVICASSGSKNLVGKAAQSAKDLDFSFGAFCKVVRPKGIYPSYLGNYFKSKKYRQIISSMSAGANINNLRGEHIDDLLIPLPPLEIQEKIACTLDKVSELLALRRKQLEELDVLIQAIFYEMFGDPVLNEKGWNMEFLQKLGILKNGLNYTNQKEGLSTKILGVGDFRNNQTISDFSTFSVINTTEKLIDDYYLKNNDLVFVRSNGSRELVGRCVIVFPMNELVTFSGFCIRLRLISQKILPFFLLFVLSNANFKKNLFDQGQGCNINNINQAMLSKLLIPIPPIELQNKFANIIQKIEEQKQLVQKSIDETQLLFDSLMSQYFD